MALILHTAPIRELKRYRDNGKALELKFLRAQFPRGAAYVEPYGCRLIMGMPRSKMETVNDCDGEISNFFKILRDRGTRSLLADHILCGAEIVEGADRPIARASTFYRQSCASLISGETCSFPEGDREVLSLFGPLVKRLQGVQIESLRPLEVVGRYDAPCTCFVVSSPVGASDNELEQLVKRLADVKGMVILLCTCRRLPGGTPSGWHSIESRSPDALDGGSVDSQSQVIWTNRHVNLSHP